MHRHFGLSRTFGLPHFFRHEKTAESIDILRIVLTLSCVVRKVSGTLSGAGGTCSRCSKYAYFR